MEILTKGEIEITDETEKCSFPSIALFATMRLCFSDLNEMLCLEARRSESESESE